MEHLDKVKQDVLKSINYARNSATALVEGVIECDNMNQLTNVLSATEEARSMALILTRLFPGDDYIKHTLEEANSVYHIGYKGKERFITECKCKNRKKLK